MILNANQIIIIISFLFFLVTPFIFQKKTKIDTKSGDSFATGNNNYSWFRLTAGLSATFIGGATVLNSGAMGYQYGWYALADILPTVLALIIVSLFMVGKIKKKNVQTLGQLLGNDNRIKIVSGLLATFTYTLITAAQIIALTALLETYFEFKFIALLVTVVVGLYVSFGGFKSVTITDVVQFIFMIVCYLLFSIYVLAETRVKTAVSNATFETLPLDIILLLALTFFFVPSSQDVHIRIQSSKSLKAAKKGSLIAAFVFLVFGVTSILIGIVAKQEQLLHANNPDKILPLFLEHKLGHWAIVPMLGVIAIIISTLDSVLFNAVTSFTYDFIGGLKKSKQNFNKESKLITFLILGIALVISQHFPSILSLILFALVLYVSILLPLLMANQYDLINAYSFIISIVVLLTIFILELLKINFPGRYIAYTLIHFLLLYASSFISTKTKL